MNDLHNTLVDPDPYLPMIREMEALPQLLSVLADTLDELNGKDLTTIN